MPPAPLAGILSRAGLRRAFPPAWPRVSDLFPKAADLASREQAASVLWRQEAGADRRTDNGRRRVVPEPVGAARACHHSRPGPTASYPAGNQPIPPQKHTTLSGAGWPSSRRTTPEPPQCGQVGSSGDRTGASPASSGYFRLALNSVTCRRCGSSTGSGGASLWCSMYTTLWSGVRPKLPTQSAQTGRNPRSRNPRSHSRPWGEPGRCQRKSLAKNDASNGHPPVGFSRRSGRRSGSVAGGRSRGWTGRSGAMGRWACSYDGSNEPQ
jgi:hypothetical protein